MDFQRWLLQRLDVLKMRTILDGVNGGSARGPPVPRRVRAKYFDSNPDEANRKGETLMMCVILYLTEKDDQVRYMNLLLRTGADVNLQDKKGRTALMHASGTRNLLMAELLLHANGIKLALKDNVGNTALMHAVLSGQSDILKLHIEVHVRSWSFDVFSAKNAMGNNAEKLAIKACNFQQAALIRSKRIRMLQRMYKQLALLNTSASLKGWTPWLHTYHVVRTWKQKQKRRALSLPVIATSDRALLVSKEMGLLTNDLHMMFVREVKSAPPWPKTEETQHSSRSKLKIRGRRSALL